MGTSLQHKFAKRKGRTIAGGLFNSLAAKVGGLPHFHKKSTLFLFEHNWLSYIYKLLSSLFCYTKPQSISWAHSNRTVALPYKYRNDEKLGTEYLA